MAISMPLAILAALLMIGTSQYGYQKTNDLLSNLTYAHNTRTITSILIRDMLDAETGLRSYLLTDDDKLLTAYQQAVQRIRQWQASTQDRLKDAPEAMQWFTPLARSINHKIAEMDLSLRLALNGDPKDLQFLAVNATEMQNMQDVQLRAQQLDAFLSQKAGEFEQRIQASLMWAHIGVTTITLIGLLAFYLYLRQNKLVARLHRREQALQSEERSRLEQLVRERTATLTKLATHLQQVREDERGHLARELHDELGALLTAAKLDVARLKTKIDMENPEVADRVNHLTDTLNSGIALKRRIVEDLRPSSLANLGLCTALEILTSDFSKRSGLTMEVHLEPVELGESTELTIYRLVQEALTNIGKYAQATTVQVSIHRFPTYVAVQIADNGRGFDTSNIQPNSHGLAGMRHRVEAAGGRLTIQSRFGEGTTVSAVIPTSNSTATQGADASQASLNRTALPS